MPIESRAGDLLEQADIDVLCHGCNCQNVMGAGLALAIKTRWPEAYEVDCKTAEGDSSKLGAFSYAKVQRGDKPLTIINAYLQFDYGGNDRRYVNYEAVALCFESIERQVLDSKKPLVIGVPRFIGCGLAGGNWGVVEAILKAVFEHSPVKLVIVELPRAKA